jgi:predicted small lipoprotein YifL
MLPVMKVICLAVFMLLVSLAACERKGPAEKAGEAIDRAGEKASRSIEKAAENVRDAAQGK